MSKPNTCENARHPLLPLTEHAYALYLVVTEDVVMGALPEPMRIGDWLILAAGLSSVTIVTNGLGEDDAYCSNIYEEDRGRGASAAARELTRLLFVWGATENLQKNPRCPRVSNESPAK